MGSVVDQAEAALDGPEEVVGLAELGPVHGAEDPRPLQAVERVPEVRSQQVGALGGVDEQQELDDELDVGDTADPALEVVSPARLFELSPHGQDLGTE